MRIIGLLIVIGILVAATSDVPGQPRTSTPAWRKLAEKSISLLTLSKDLREMAKARQRDLLEPQLAMDLAASASTAGDYLNAASDLLFIYNQLASQADRATIKPFINERLDRYAQSLEFEIKSVNIGLSYSTSAGIAATGARLRDELREAMALLKAITIK